MNWNRDAFKIDDDFYLMSKAIGIEQCNWPAFFENTKPAVSFYNIFFGDEKLFSENTVAIWRKKEVNA